MITKKAFITGAIGLVSIIIVVWTVISPYMYLNSVRSAINSRDTNRLERLVDFQQTSATLAASFRQNDIRNEEDELAATLASVIVETMFTSQNIIALVGDDSSSLLYNMSTLDQKYIDFNTFQISVSTLPDQNNIISNITTVIERRNLIHWEATSLTLSTREYIPVARPVQHPEVDPIQTRFLTSNYKVYCEQTATKISCMNEEKIGFTCLQDRCVEMNNHIPFDRNVRTFWGEVNIQNIRCDMVQREVLCSSGNSVSLDQDFLTIN